jgi:hypothetical protein
MTRILSSAFSLFVIAPIFLLVTVSLASLGSDRFPAQLVGVWANDNSLLRNNIVVEGLAVYLGADGVGAVLAAPPPIGYRIESTFDPKSNTIHSRITENGRTIGTKVFSYNPASQTISANNEHYARRSEQLTEATRAFLGLEPTRR